MKIQYKGVHEIILDNVNFTIIVKTDDIIEIEPEIFENKLKNYVHNGNPVWIAVDQKPKKESKKNEDIGGE